MKKLLLTLIFALIMSASTKQFAQNDVRPYLHWKVEFVKINEETNEVQKDSVLINTLQLEDAISDFRVQCPYCEIRAMYRDYYYESCTER